MTHDARVGIVGRGYALGDIIRGNDDPVFAYINAHPPADHDLFAGLTWRRVLGADQSLVSIAAAAARSALDSAGLAAQDVDLLLGSASVGDYYAPSALAAVHAELRLPDRCRVLALNTEYTSFLDGLKLAHDLIRGGSMTRALVITAVDWTAHMDYRSAVAVAASDAAGAAVVGPTHDPTVFALVDWDNETNTQLYGVMQMAPRRVAPLPRTPEQFTTPLFELDATTGAHAVRTFGVAVPPMVTNRLLARHGLRGQDVTLIAHQVSQPIQQEWRARIGPAAYVSTLTDCADMVSATVPVNLAMCYDQIETDHLVLLGVGMDMHATALLYRRSRRRASDP